MEVTIKGLVLKIISARYIKRIDIEEIIRVMLRLENFTLRKHMVSRIQSGALIGISGYKVEVEVHLALGTPAMSIVGLPDAAVKESANRVEAALKNTKLGKPLGKVTVNLALRT